MKMLYKLEQTQSLDMLFPHLYPLLFLPPSMLYLPLFTEKHNPAFRILSVISESPWASKHE